MFNVYVCGPTVYDDAHLGHARTYIVTDMIVRSLRLQHPQVHFAMNITDIDDKIINKAAAEKSDWRTIAQHYEQSFRHSMKQLNVLSPDSIMRVSESIVAIQNYIQQILDNGLAYIIDDACGKSIYFDSLAYQKLGYRLPRDTESTELKHKRDMRDFVLWKARSSSEVHFDITINDQGTSHHLIGRPGWHIECSAMIDKLFGPHLNLHLGGIDLKFPHHANERLQAHAYYHGKQLFSDEKPWTDFLHIGHLEIKGLKMSKSLKNFITVEQALKVATPNQLRLMFATHTWTNSMEFNDENIEHARRYDQRLAEFLSYQLENSDNLAKKNDESDREDAEITAALARFDFQTVIDLLINLVSLGNKNLRDDLAMACHLQHRIKKWLTLLGFVYETTTIPDVKMINESWRAALAHLASFVSDCSFVKEIVEQEERSAPIDDLDPLIQHLIAMRTKIRLGLSSKNQPIPRKIKCELYRLLDEQRDKYLLQAGIKLIDMETTSIYRVI